MRFLIDSMLPPRIAELLAAGGHDAATPVGLGAHNLPDDALVDFAAAEGRVIVTENARDFAHVDMCAVLLVRKLWWARRSLDEQAAAAIDRWAIANPDPGHWAHWLPAPLR